jgi:hypothetical protein
MGDSPGVSNAALEQAVTVTNAMVAQGIISGLAATLFITPLALLLGIPALLELAAVAGSPETLATAGMPYSGQEIAELSSTSLPDVAATVGGEAQ